MPEVAVHYTPSVLDLGWVLTSCSPKLRPSDTSEITNDPELVTCSGCLEALAKQTELTLLLDDPSVRCTCGHNLYAHWRRAHRVLGSCRNNVVGGRRCPCQGFVEVAA